MIMSHQKEVFKTVSTTVHSVKGVMLEAAITFWLM
jgi:hypothetical protein